MLANISVILSHWPYFILHHSFRPAPIIPTSDNEFPLPFHVPSTSLSMLSTAFPALIFFASLLNCDSRFTLAALETPWSILSIHTAPLCCHHKFPVGVKGLDTDTKSLGSSIIPLRIPVFWDITGLEEQLKGESSGQEGWGGNQKCLLFSCFALSYIVAVRSRSGAGLTSRGLGQWFPIFASLFIQDKVLTTLKQLTK